MTFSRHSEKPVIFRIKEIIPEARDISTFWFDGDIKAKPGQFVMLWIPGAGLKPFGVSYQEKGMFGLTIRKVGPFTEKLFAMEAGDMVGIQGPYGRAFSEKGEKVALVGGGYGTAPLAFLAEELAKEWRQVYFIIGAATKDLLLYGERFRNRNVKMIYSTDDGSLGHKGFCTDCLLSLLSNERIDRVYCCGPEMMMMKAFEICADKGIPAEFSLERHMKCGFGVCGSCALDGTGWRVCTDGPVFTLDELKKVTEFGKYKRDGAGGRAKL